MEVSEFTTWCLDDSDLVRSSVVSTFPSLLAHVSNSPSIFKISLRAVEERKRHVRVSSSVLEALVGHLNGIDEDYLVVEGWERWSLSISSM